MNNTDPYQPWVDKFQKVEDSIAAKPAQDYAPLPSEMHLWGGKTANSNTWCHYLLQKTKLLDVYDKATSKLQGGDLPWAPGWYIPVPYNDAPIKK